MTDTSHVFWTQALWLIHFIMRRVVIHIHLLSFTNNTPRASEKSNELECVFYFPLLLLRIFFLHPFPIMPSNHKSAVTKRSNWVVRNERNRPFKKKATGVAQQTHRRMYITQKERLYTLICVWESFFSGTKKFDILRNVSVFLSIQWKLMGFSVLL